MHTLKTFFAALFLMLGLMPMLPVHAQVAPATAESLMRKSGLWESLAHTGPQMHAGFASSMAQQPSGAPSAAEAERLERVVKQAYAADSLRSSTLAALAQQLQAPHIAALNSWYDSAAGRRITKLEETSSADLRDPQITLREGAELLAAASPGRRLTLERVAQVSRAAEAMASITIHTALAVHTGLARSPPQAPAGSADDLRRVLEGQRAGMLQAYGQVSLLLFAHSYQSLADEELARYLAFLETPAGTHFTDASLQALDHTLQQAAERLGRGLAGVRDGANS